MIFQEFKKLLFHFLSEQFLKMSWTSLNKIFSNNSQFLGIFSFMTIIHIFSQNLHPFAIEPIVTWMPFHSNSKRSHPCLPLLPPLIDSYILTLLLHRKYIVTKYPHLELIGVHFYEASVKCLQLTQLPIFIFSVRQVPPDYEWNLFLS